MGGLQRQAGPPLHLHGHGPERQRPTNLTPHAATEVDGHDREPGRRRARRLLQPRRRRLAGVRPPLRRPRARGGRQPAGLRLALARPLRGDGGLRAERRARHARAAHRGLRVPLRALPAGRQGGARPGRRRPDRLRRPQGGAPRRQQRRRRRLGLGRRLHRAHGQRVRTSRTTSSSSSSRTASPIGLDRRHELLGGRDLRALERRPRGRGARGRPEVPRRTGRRSRPTRSSQRLARRSKRSRRCRRCRRRRAPPSCSARARTSTP